MGFLKKAGVPAFCISEKIIPLCYSLPVKQITSVSESHHCLRATCYFTLFLNLKNYIHENNTTNFHLCFEYFILL
jgi:hypothetical protein